MRKMILALSAFAVAIPTAAVIPASGASAQRYYDRNGNYVGRTWKGSDGRVRCRRSNGTTGLVVGGVAGALVGRTIDTGGDRTIGTLGGAALGALAGRAVEKSTSKRRCR